MSSQKGNVNRTRAQKYRNSTVFKNTKYDTSQRTKNILNTNQDGLCARCREKIAWKVKYKKYKPLKQPASCIRCHQKTVKKAYYTVCQPCATSLEICGKCAQKKEIVSEFGPDAQTQEAEQNQMEQELKFLSERERRTLLRLKAQGKLTEGLDKKEDDDEAGGVDQEECDDDSDFLEDSDVDCDDDDDAEKVDAHTLFD